MKSDNSYDALVIGSGMGGLSTAVLLANDGYKILVLEASSAPGGCSSSYYRKKGRVGGIPKSMARSLLKWTPNQTPFTGLYRAGDTTYPGQGIPGVILSGINVYWRIIQNKI